MKIDTLEDVFVEIRKRCGMEGLKNGQRLLGLFLDIAPQQLKKQRKVLEEFINIDGPAKIFAVQNDTIEEQAGCIRRIVSQLKEEMFFEETVCHTICESFCSAVTGRHITKGASEKQEEEERRQSDRSISEEDAIAQKITPEAQFYKGLEFYNKKDYIPAAEWYEKAAMRGYAPAQCKLGKCYYWGHGVGEYDMLGRPRSYGGLGGIFIGNPQKAVYWYRKAAEQGNAEAQIALGDCYGRGEGVERSYQKAVQWYSKAAELGNAEAQTKLGNCYFEGKGINRDYQRAVHWYEKAAKQQYSVAMNSMGDCCISGRGVKQDKEKGVWWYGIAAEQGNSTAQENLGDCYFLGNGVKRNIRAAARWYWMSAKQGNDKAQLKLGYCYETGTGIEQNIKEAVVWYKKAADMGNATAQYYLGRCYELGKGVQQNYKEAIRWYGKATEKGNDDAKNNLERLQNAE